MLYGFAPVIIQQERGNGDVMVCECQSMMRMVAKERGLESDVYTYQAQWGQVNTPDRKKEK
jgi:hypothetical protein